LKELLASKLVSFSLPTGGATMDVHQEQPKPDWSGNSNQFNETVIKEDQPKLIPEKTFEVFDKPNRYLNHTGPKHEFAYPFEEMDIGQAFFVPVEQSSNVDKLIANLHRAINTFHKQTSVAEKDENGDDIMENVTVLPKKRDINGVIQLDSAGNSILGANGIMRPSLIHVAQFVIKPAIKDDEIAEGKKAESDGALVIRVA
jgi:hypothetical protein